MTSSSPSGSGFINLIIEGLPSTERKYMLKYGRSVKLELGAVLCEAGEPIQQIYFPVEGFISQAASNDGVLALEMGLIGSEGMLGATLLLGEINAPIGAVVQSAGSALAMSSAQFGRALCQNPKLMRTLNRYLFTTLQQWSLVAFCVHYHQTQARLARFLLVAHDRMHLNTFFITQDTLAKLLGVRRSSITLAASELQKQGFIQYNRGYINITDRAGLEASSCACYLQIKSIGG
jgi:CRP-like cAMP-binding protein